MCVRLLSHVFYIESIFSSFSMTSDRYLTVDMSKSSAFSRAFLYSARIFSSLVLMSAPPSFQHCPMDIMRICTVKIATRRARAIHFSDMMASNNAMVSEI